MSKTRSLGFTTFRWTGLAFWISVSTLVLANEDNQTYANPRFSPDGQKLSFNLCISKKCTNAVYNIAEDRFYSYRDTGGKGIVYVAFSPSGKQTAVLYHEHSRWPSSADVEQIAVRGSDGRAFETVTASKSEKRYPVFWDEESLLFTGQDVTNSKARFKHVSIVNFLTKTERKITRDEFFGPSGPVPFGDSEHFVMSEFGYSRSQLSLPDRAKTNSSDEVLFVSVNTGKIVPINTGILASSRPASAAKQVYFVGRLEQESKKNWYYVYDIFLHASNGPQRVTQLAKHISGLDVSQDARHLAVIVSEADGKKALQKLLIYNMERKDYRHLVPNNITDVTVTIQNWRDQ